MARHKARRAGVAGAPGARAVPAPAGRAAARAPAAPIAPVFWAPVWLAMLVVASFAIRPGVLHAPFYGDDFNFLELARGHTLWGALTAPDPLGNYFRPISRPLTFWVLGRLGHESPLAFHLTSWALWVTILALLLDLTRRLAGVRAALIATAFLALHYAADVALLWASDLQDLLATAGALGTLVLYTRGRRVAAALTLAVALLSKESTALVPVLAVLIDRQPTESWRAALRRAWPLWACFAAWLALWLFMSTRRVAGAVPLHPGPLAPVAALFHLVQVATGLEWQAGRPGPLVEPLRLAFALIVVIAGIFALWGYGARQAGGGSGATTAAGSRAAAPGGVAAAAGATPKPRAAPRLPDPRAAVRVGLAWAVLGALPVSAAIRFWSAYGYLFALCGVALALGAWAAGRPRIIGAALVALLALGSDAGRGISSLAIDYTPWTMVSHIDVFGLLRGMSYNVHGIAALRALHPTFPARSSLFFAGLPKGTAFQTGDGPLVRWAYRDSSLHSYYWSSFSIDKARHGPTYFFSFNIDSLSEVQQDADFYRRMALGLMLGDSYAPARDLLTLGLEKDPNDQASHYWLGMLEWERGRRDTAAVLLRAAGMTPDRGPTPEIKPALERFAAGDTARALELLIGGTARHGLDPAAHATLADIALRSPQSGGMGTVEALAARILAPDDPSMWRAWGLVQVAGHRYDQAGRSLDHYLAIGGAAAAADSQVARTRRALGRVLPGGDVARRVLSGEAPPPH
jgi:hypothetical protein